MEDDHSLPSFLSVAEGELEDHVEVDDVDEVDDDENQGDHFTHADDNSSESEYEDDSGEKPTTTMNRTRTQEWKTKKRIAGQV